MRSHGAAGHGGGWNQASEAPRRRNQYNLTPPRCLASRLHRIYVALLGRHQFRSYLEMCISKYLVILERQNVAFPHVNENLKSNAVDILLASSIQNAEKQYPSMLRGKSALFQTLVTISKSIISHTGNKQQ